MIHSSIPLYSENGADGGVSGSSAVLRIVDVMSVRFFKLLNKISNYFYSHQYLFVVNYI